MPGAASSLLLSYTSFYSPAARALALLALADLMRAPRMGPTEVGERARLIRRAVYLLSEPMTHNQEPLLSPKYPPFVALSSRWPLFQMADRLACQAPG